MSSDALAGEIFIDDDLIRQGAKNAVVQKSRRQKVQPIWQWLNIGLSRQAPGFVIITVSIVLNAALKIAQPRLAVDFIEPLNFFVIVYEIRKI